MTPFMCAPPGGPPPMKRAVGAAAESPPGEQKEGAGCAKPAHPSDVQHPDQEVPACLSPF